MIFFSSARSWLGSAILTIIILATACQDGVSISNREEPGSDAWCEREIRSLYTRDREISEAQQKAYFLGDQEKLWDLMQDANAIRKRAGELDNICPPDLAERIVSEFD